MQYSQSLRSSSLRLRLGIALLTGALAGTMVWILPVQAIESRVETPKLAQARTAQTYAEQGDRLYKQKKFKEAIASYRKAIQLNPNYGAAYVGLGNALDDSGQSQAAVPAYLKALDLQPNDPIIYYNLGITQYRLKNFEAAITTGT